MSTNLEPCVGTPFVAGRKNQPEAAPAFGFSLFAGGRTGARIGLRRKLEDLVATMFAWRERTRQRRDLLALDARELRDVGLSRADAEREGRKPFWRA